MAASQYSQLISIPYRSIPICPHESDAMARAKFRFTGDAMIGFGSMVDIKRGGKNGFEHRQTWC
jgi:hypothetical protein